MYFPITIIDNFYDNFDQLKKFTENVQFFKKTFFTMPGIETEPLHKINPHLFHQGTTKILSLFYGRHGVKKTDFLCTSKIEKMISYGKNFDSNGWIHNDDDNKLSGILYIQGNENEGTSFYINNKVGLHNCAETDKFEIKEKLYKGENINSDEYNFHLREHNKNFKKILTIPNLPNRLVLFDSSILHAADGIGSLEKPRIIQTFFFSGIRSEYFPIPELRRIK